MSYLETTPLKNSTIMFLYSERPEINLGPSYQRMGSIWTIEKRQLLIDSILNDYDIPKIYFHALSNETYKKTGRRYAVIDGRQRLETIWSFMDGDFRLAENFEYQRDTDIDLSTLNYAEIAHKYPKIKVKFDSFVLPVVAISTEGDDLELIEDMFSRLNEAVPLNAAEKRNAIGGNLVQAIRDVSEHIFFTKKVKFSNRRFQHREIAARFLLIEENLLKDGRIIDTKKVYLDSFAEQYKSDHKRHVSEIKKSCINVLDAMSNILSDKDELLQAQGILSVYYLVFRNAIEFNELGKVTRKKLLNFKRKLEENREEAASEYTNASFDLLTFDRLNQQGTNDASNIKERYRILASSLKLSTKEM